MELIIPNWEAPKNVKAFSTTRMGGVSDGVYKGLNLGMHVEDDPVLVNRNREILHDMAALPTAQVWLNQTHSDHVIVLKQPTTEVLDGDGAITSVPKVICTVMTADCLPVLLTDTEGAKVAAVHAGWRGLADGILENAVKNFTKPVIAWLGPAIGVSAFEVGQDVVDIFVSHSQQAQKAFLAKDNGKYLADMNMLATQRLNYAGVKTVYRSNMCTFEDSEKFYSYRRDGVTGRQATFIWID
ncbi:peptidoglycan editing factor PgeF [Vibrio algarum]|uniref:Purine nucleoside phosphorylase n=1 Tax=Vibrio algarum TaxID=3020714 RepID=A0ABT4YTA8_9VIBR|nr:peptidoglycan editing factor PgeF [Vibrio sp. KJ40-1]MDB1124793.1 peptidoglycan editing factor PgeF [Vibrio sp. KJ40-1]